jgi:hypothetical protein
VLVYAGIRVQYGINLQRLVAIYLGGYLKAGGNFMQFKSEKTDVFLQRRRQLLKMGAAGMPMVLTLRASAAEAVISQLRCTITISNSFKILVDDAGAAWVGKGKLKSKRNGQLRPKSVRRFKKRAQFVFPHDSAPSGYRPDECEYKTCDNTESDDSEGHDELLSHLVDVDGTYALNDFLAGDEEDDEPSEDECDDDGHALDAKGNGIVENAPCGYAVYEYRSNHVITPGAFVGENGNLHLSGDDGLFLELSLIYADENGTEGNWPGVSCLVSVLNYIKH